jgi:predicted kinase
MEAIIFIGIQASGKSTFYKDNFFKTHMRINLDMLKTRHREDIMLEACIKGKLPFVVDNTNPTAVVRRKYIDLAKTAGYKVIGYYFHTSIDEAILRNEKREGKECIPLLGIRSTQAKLQVPGLDEGFDELYNVRIDKENKFIVEGYKHEV